MAAHRIRFRSSTSSLITCTDHAPFAALSFTGCTPACVSSLTLLKNCATNVCTSPYARRSSSLTDCTGTRGSWLSQGQTKPRPWRTCHLHRNAPSWSLVASRRDPEDDLGTPLVKKTRLSVGPTTNSQNSTLRVTSRAYRKLSPRVKIAVPVHVETSFCRRPGTHKVRRALVRRPERSPPRDRADRKH